MVIAACLELLVAASGSESRGAARWAGAGVAGAALGPVAGGLLTSAISWQSIFIVQVPLVLAAVPTALAGAATRGATTTRRCPPTARTWRPTRRWRSSPRR